jgi:hypothetical protein
VRIHIQQHELGSAFTVSQIEHPFHQQRFGHVREESIRSLATRAVYNGQRLLGSEGKVDSLFVLSGHVCAYATPLAEVVGLLCVVEFPVTNNPMFYPEIQPSPCVGDGDGKAASAHTEITVQTQKHLQNVHIYRGFVSR